MEVTTTRDGDTLVLAVSGRINTTTASAFEAKVKEAIPGITNLVLDFAEVLYISSAGLRVILATQKAMSKQGTLVVRNVKPEVYEVFEMTGFVDFLTIE